MKNTPTKPIRVALVDDHTLLREILKGILNAELDIEVVGDAADRNGCLAMIEKERPSLVLLDICLGHDDGLDRFVRPIGKLPGSLNEANL